MLLDQEEISNTVTMNGPDSTDVTLKSLKNRKNLCEDKQQMKAVKGRLNGRVKENHLDCSSPPAKRRRKLIACTNADTGHSVVSVLETQQETHRCCSDAIELTQAGSSDDKFSSTSSSRGSPIETIEHLYEKPRPEPLFDLNLPHVPPDDELGDFIKELTNEQDDLTSKDREEPYKASAAVDSSEQQPNENYRRHSTRNRPPTARALEALANGFLTTNRRRKSNGLNSTSRPSRRAPTVAGVTEFSTGNASTVKEDTCSGGNINILSKFMVLSEGNGTQVSGP